MRMGEGEGGMGPSGRLTDGVWEGGGEGCGAGEEKEDEEVHLWGGLDWY